MLTEHKGELRKYYRSIRSSLSQEMRAQKDAVISKSIADLVGQIGCTTVFLYQPFRGEPDLLGLRGLLPGMNIAFPVVEKKAAGEMCFVLVKDESQLKLNRFGILEPIYEKKEEVFPTPDTLVVVPALAVDLSGIRLGYGGGYYDRYFSRFSTGTRPILVSAVYAELLVAALPREDHDVAMDYVVTDRSIHKVTRDHEM